jgi:hypothetical protein
MTNWQFITLIGTFVLSSFGFILTILGTARSKQWALNEKFTALQYFPLKSSSRFYNLPNSNE